MMQTLAILNDSLRELRSRSLFWIALIISVFVSVVLFGLIGFNDKGWYLLWLDTNPSETVRAGSQGMRDLLGWLFGGALLWWWLTWGAIVIALIVNASTVPEFVSSGSIDMVLAKPIGRVRLFLVKVLGALLFTLLQVTACVLVAYLLVGLRFGIWFHDAWLAVPLVTLQFLYLFAVMALVGLVTRSTLASLLAALIFWGVVSWCSLHLTRLMPNWHKRRPSSNSRSKGSPRFGKSPKPKRANRLWPSKSRFDALNRKWSPIKAFAMRFCRGKDQSIRLNCSFPRPGTFRRSSPMPWMHRL